MTATKTARQKLRNTTRYYGYTFILCGVVLEYVSRIVPAESIPQGDSTSPVPYPSQSRSQKESAIITQ
ncbi:MAG TPA: hypothetical protein DCP92_25075 [Nitrospiraceae bacterium]|jgi:hypothetical protein|nr:hypothetical protein [Nitrospiraceae bacterium]